MFSARPSCDFQDKGFDERETAGAGSVAASVPYFYAVDNKRERASHVRVPYFWVPLNKRQAYRIFGYRERKSPAKSCWPSDDEEAVNEYKSIGCWPLVNKDVNNEDKSSGRWPLTTMSTKISPAKSCWPSVDEDVDDKVSPADAGRQRGWRKKALLCWPSVNEDVDD